MAELFDIDRSTASVAIQQVRPLLAARGFAVPDRPGVRLRTLSDVFACAESLWLTERAPQVGPGGIRA